MHKNNIAFKTKLNDLTNEEEKEVYDYVVGNKDMYGCKDNNVVTSEFITLYIQHLNELSATAIDFNWFISSLFNVNTFVAFFRHMYNLVCNVL